MSSSLKKQRRFWRSIWIILSFVFNAHLRCHKGEWYGKFNQQTGGLCDELDYNYKVALFSGDSKLQQIVLNQLYATDRNV